MCPVGKREGWADGALCLANKMGVTATFLPTPSQGAVSGSVQATDRLMKELRDIYRSASFKGGKYVLAGCMSCTAPVPEGGVG